MGAVVLGGLFVLIAFWLYMGWRDNAVYHTRMRALNMYHQEWGRLLALAHIDAPGFYVRLDAAESFAVMAREEWERVSYDRMWWTFWRKPSSLYDWSKFRAEVNRD